MVKAIEQLEAHGSSGGAVERVELRDLAGAVEPIFESVK
jgi:hypothetical protein